MPCREQIVLISWPGVSHNIRYCPGYSRTTGRLSITVCNFYHFYQTNNNQQQSTTIIINNNSNNNNNNNKNNNNKTLLPLSTNFVPYCGRNRPPFTCKGVLINVCYTLITYRLRGPGDSQTATEVPCHLDHWYWTVSRDRRPTGSCVSRSLK